MSFADADIDTLNILRGNLAAGLDLVAASLDNGTFSTIAPGKSSPPSQSGHLTLTLLAAVDEELARREKAAIRPRVVLCDIDGTIADMRKDQPGRRSPFDWHRVGEDEPIVPIINLIGIFRAVDLPIVYISGRDESCRHITEHWMSAHDLLRADEPLYMRPANDNRPDHDVKHQIYRKQIEPRYDVAYVLDDRDQVVRMWRMLGLTVLQVADGNF